MPAPCSVCAMPCFFLSVLSMAHFHAAPCLIDFLRPWRRLWACPHFGQFGRVHNDTIALLALFWADVATIQDQPGRNPRAKYSNGFGLRFAGNIHDNLAGPARGTTAARQGVFLPILGTGLDFLQYPGDDGHGEISPW